VETKLKSLFLRYGVENIFGVALVHRHFDPEEGTVLVEKDMVTAPWKCDGSFVKHSGRIIPISWFFKGGISRPKATPRDQRAKSFHSRTAPYATFGLDQ
jgi:hypothetical protein